MAPINVLVDAPKQLPQIPQQSSARDRLSPSEKVLPDKRKNVAASLLHPPGDVPSVPKTSSLDLPLKAPGVPEGPPPELLDNTESEEVGIPVINVENAAEENDFSVSPQSWKIFSDDGPHCPPSGKEGMFVVIPEATYLDKARTALAKNFIPATGKYSKIKSSALALLEDLNLSALVRYLEGDNPGGCQAFSLDVEDLFYAIPQPELMVAVKECITEYNDEQKFVVL
ncbi:hypothetical protein HPB52_007352 [Rhipicephalus sanguineus]|uniref:Uncharacterized protein n=1 Tax=Rhipicephalus sanguineus TaxID=34632 RepID=A0A9D4QJ57_RHISA|nr:hypothetical protein HPB52_007352 [Rhipicephalus sanguineus]